MTSFISHTVGAMVMLPIVQSVGEEVAHATGVDHTRLLIMGCALMCSGGMALSISGFPNITASSILSPTGIPYVRAVDFALAGIPGTIFALISVLVVGYPLMQLVGF